MHLLLDLLRPELNAIPTLLPPAKRHVMGHGGGHIYANAASLQALDHPEGAREVASEDAGLQAKLRVFCTPQHFLLAVEGAHALHRAEGLLAHDTAVVGRLEDDGRLDEVASASLCLPAGQELAASVARALQEGLDGLELLDVGLRATLRSGRQRVVVAGRVIALLAEGFHQGAAEGGDDAAVDVDSRSGDTCLARVE